MVGSLALEESVTLEDMNWGSGYTTVHITVCFLRDDFISLLHGSISLSVS